MERWFCSFGDDFEAEILNMSFLKKSRFQLVLLFLFVLLVRFYPMMLDKTLFFGDNYMLMVPGKLFTANWIKQGVLPLWNPTILGGIPWIGDVNQSVFYPTTLLFVILSPGVALNLTLIFHLAVAFLGSYKLTKVLILKFFNFEKLEFQKIIHWSGLFAAILFTLSTQLTGALNNISSLQSIVWLPWVIYFGLSVSIYSFMFPIIVLIQFLGGYPQHVIFSILFAVFVSFFSNFLKDNKFDIKLSDFLFWLKNWLVVGVFTVGLSAFIWLPFLETLGNSTRAIQSNSQAVSGSLHPIDLVKIVFPYFFDKPTAGMKWGPNWNSMTNMSIYLTWFSLVIILFSFFGKKITNFKITNPWTNANKFKIGLVFLTIATLLFSFGENLPGYLFLQQNLPIFSSSRSPSVILIMTNFSLILLVTFMFAEILLKVFKNQKTKLIKYEFNLKLIISLLAVFTVVAFTLLVIVNIRFDEIWNFINELLGGRLTSSIFHTLEKDRVIAKIIIENVFINAFFTTAALFLWQKKKIVFVLMIIVLDMVYNTQGHLFFAPNKVYQDYKNNVLSVQSDAEFPSVQDLNESRVLIRNFNAPYTDFGAYFEAISVRAPFSDSFVDEKEFTDFDNLSRRAKGLTPDWNMPANINVITGYTTLMPRDIDYLWRSGSDIDEPSINDLPEIIWSNKYHGSTLQNWAVKYYLVDSWFDVTEHVSSLKKLAEYDRWSLYELPDTLSRFRYEDGTQVDFQGEISGYCNDFCVNPNTLKLKIDNTDNHKFLIIADRYDKNWQAEVNGKKVELKNYMGMRRIPLENGMNDVVVKYVPKVFKLGLLISGATLFLMLGLNKYYLHQRKMFYVRKKRKKKTNC